MNTRIVIFFILFLIGDLQLLFFLTEKIIFDLLYWMLNTTSPWNQNGLTFLNWNFSFYFAQNMSFFFAIKFFLCIALLILIRGGAPRYRYDFLTKLGWLKFLSFIILMLVTSLFLFLLF